MAVFANDFVSNHVVIDGFEKLLLDNILFFFEFLKQNTVIGFFYIVANIGNHSIYLLTM